MRNLFTLASALFLAAAQAQIANGGFETVIPSKDPENVPSLAYNWSYGAPYGNGLVDDAHGGNYAMAVWNWYWYAEGYVTNGNAAWPALGGLPVTGRPDQLTGWYKRISGMMQAGEWNQAQVLVLMTHWNTATQQRDTVGGGVRLFDVQAAWAPFTLDITYTSEQDADTVVVQLASCISCMCEGSSTGECAYFYVDDLALNTTTGMHDVLLDDGMVRLIPQDDGSVLVRVNEHASLPLRLQLWDAVGRIIGDVQVTTDGQHVALAAATGVTAFRASTKQRTLAQGKVVLR